VRAGFLRGFHSLAISALQFLHLSGSKAVENCPKLLRSVPIPLNFGPADPCSEPFISDRRKQAALRNDSQGADRAARLRGELPEKKRGRE
jgi:hypothetical protein